MKLSDKAQASINKVIEQFKSGDLSPISTVARIKVDPSAPVYKWSLSNKVLAFVQAGELDCRGFRQWQEVGRSVRKGSKAVYIFRPHTIKVKEEDSGEDLQKSVCVGFSAIPVFAASSTEGDDLSSNYQPQELPPLYHLANRFGIAVSFVPVIPDKLGDAKIDGTSVRIGTHDESVFFHELGHDIHAKIDGDLKGGQQTDQETVAEFTSAVLMDFYGIRDNSGNAWQYISQYSKEPLLAITKALGTVEKVLAVLLESETS